MPICSVCGKRAGGFSLRGFNTINQRCDQCEAQAAQRVTLAMERFRSLFRDLAQAGPPTKQDWARLERIAVENDVNLETVAAHSRDELHQTFAAVVKNRPVTDPSDSVAYLVHTLSLPSYLVEEAKAFANMSKEVAVSCVRCAAGVRGRSADSGYVCSACGASAVLARCSRCCEVIQISHDYFEKGFECFICGHFRYWSGWNESRITLGEMAQALPEDQRIVADPDRRRTYGLFLGGSGYGLTRGYSVLLDFTADNVVISRYTQRQKREVVGRAAYSDVRSLQVGGRGVISSGGGWVGGGFGVSGIISGVLLASALNQITTRSSIETLVYFKTTAGELILYNNSFAPDDLRIMLSPSFTRIENAQRQLVVPAASIVDQLRELGELRDAGTISEDEFQLLKSKLISSI